MSYLSHFIVINVKTESKVKIEKKEDQNVQLLDIIENNSNSYILMQVCICTLYHFVAIGITVVSLKNWLQFPPCLPGLKCNDDKEESRPKRPNDSRLTTSANDKEKPAFCTMSDLNSGLIGKLEILKSGKARIRLGDNYLLVHTGSHFSSLQVRYILIISVYSWDMISRFSIIKWYFSAPFSCKVGHSVVNWWTCQSWPSNRQSIVCSVVWPFVRQGPSIKRFEIPAMLYRRHQ